MFSLICPPLLLLSPLCPFPSPTTPFRAIWPLQRAASIALSPFFLALFASFCFSYLSFFLMLCCFIEFILFALFIPPGPKTFTLCSFFPSVLSFSLHCTLEKAKKKKKMDENKHAVLAFSLYFSRWRYASKHR